LVGSASVAAEEESFPWHDPALNIADRLALATDRPLERRLMAAMAQLNCGACGYLCQSYSEAIARGEESSLTLCSPGGKETSKALRQILKESKSSDSVDDASLENTTSSPVQLGSTITRSTSEELRGYHRSQPVSARLLESHHLNREGSNKYTAHVVLDISQCGITYRVGDALGVFPTNCPSLVSELLAEVRAEDDEAVRDSVGKGRPISDVLLNDFDLSSIEDRLLETLIDRAQLDEERQFAKSALDDPSILEGMDVLDVLRRCASAKIGAAELCTLLGRLQPRLYSISSSLTAHPREVHLTIARVGYETHGRLRKGVASTMFADRLKPGDSVSVFVHRSHEFTLPAVSSTPIIMVGPGTGIAPFRAFLQEREATGASGKNWLFFGDQHEATDFLYQDELNEYGKRGVLTRLDTAFSRDQSAKVYVQDRIRERGKEVVEWLDSGAFFYVCGDAKQMACDVDVALREVVARHKGLSAQQADTYVAELRTDRRYLRDVY
jgi:sulfite reductase (NADPH) flavoprotein alpha-component